MNNSQHTGEVVEEIKNTGTTPKRTGKYGLSQRWEHFKLFDKNLVYFFAGLAFLILIFNRNLEHWGSYFLLELSCAALPFIFIPWLDQKRNPVARFIRYWYIIMAFPFLYWNVGPFIHLIFRGEFDPYILKIDAFIFGELPNIWVQQFVKPGLTEFMQISYGIYWITIPLGGAIFYFSKRYDLYEYLLHFVSITFFVSYALFILLPVAGPRFYIADRIWASYEGLFITHTLRSFVQNVGLRGGAFPSSHVGVAVMILTFMWKFKRKLAVSLILPLVMALSMATIYGQYHYFTDVLAGLIMGLVIGFIAIRTTENFLNRKQALEDLNPFG